MDGWGMPAVSHEIKQGLGRSHPFLGRPDRSLSRVVTTNPPTMKLRYVPTCLNLQDPPSPVFETACGRVGAVVGAYVCG